MSSVEHLREVISERLSAAAEEIYVVLKTTIVQYEEEIERQRKLLNMVLEPTIPLHRIVTTQQQVHTEEVVTDQQKKSIGCQKDPEPQEIKKEEEELCSGPGGQLVLKQETDALMQTPGHENISFPSSVSEPSSELQLLSTSSYVAESKKQKGRKHKFSGSTQDGKEKNNQLTNKMHTSNLHNSIMLESHCNTDTGKKSFTCDTCGHDFKCQLLLDKHLKTIREEKRKCCSHCGKVFRNLAVLKTHFRIHTGEKPYVCILCGKRFRQSQHLVYHTRQLHMTQVGERPYSCATCGRVYKSMSSLSHHMRRLHSSKSHVCLVCKKGFLDEVRLANHMSFHTVEKPFKCTICGRGFNYKNTLSRHMTRIHSGDRPYLCKICGKSFNSADLSKHMITHVM